MSNNPCNGCDGARNVVPFEYPYNRPARDSYGFCTCGDPRKNACKPSADRCHPGPKPNPNHFPTTGPFIGNGLSLIETYPYLVDTTCLKYGQILSYSESVHTKVTRRKDTSCINLAANFDLTDTNLTNTVLNDFFKKYTAQKYDILEGVLPILKQHLIFKIYYTITDFDGGVLHQSIIRCGSDEMCFHFTDIRDMYVTSSKCLVVENIPAMTYNGMYTFTIDKVEAYMPMLDTKQFLQDGLNPFYQFVDNNMRITLQHELIENTPTESMVLIGETPVNASIDYRANITNRVRLSFVAFMSNVIAARDTVGIWEALNEPTDEIITQLRQEMTTLEESVRLIHNKIDAQDVKIHDLEGQVELNKNNIVSHDRKIQHLESLVASYDGKFSALEARIYALEQRPLALVTYVEGKEFKTSQLTWRSYGQLYQCARAFTACGDFNKDVGLGNLIPIAADATDISAIEAELVEVAERVEKLEEIPLALVTYVEGKEITCSQLTWNGYGNLYQAAQTFIASGDFDEDVTAGNLVVVPYDKSTINAYKVIEFDKDYLFDSTYGVLDYDYAKDFFMTHTFDDMGGCTSVRKGNFFGRNFDWYYNNFAYSRVRIERSETAKYWSICNCGNIAELTNDVVKSGEYSEAYKILPFHCLDGINEKHVLCSMNVVPIGDHGLTTGTTPTSDKRDTICVVMIVRYILDNFASATEAVTYLKEHVSVYAPLKKDGTRQEIHVMVCDQTKSYLIEFIDNEMVVSDMDEVFNGRDYMTNFYNYQTSVDENNHIDYSTVTPYGNGLERYDTITDNINNVNNKDDMFALMKKVWYTHTYDFDTYGWKTELASREYDLKITDPDSKYIPYFNIGKEQFEHRTREDGKTWHTVFTSVYDIDKCRMYLMTQEDDSEISSMEYENYYTKDEIDNMDSDIEIDPYILTQSSGVTIDFDTNTVTHHGLDFDDCKPFQRKRCNVTDDGVIVAYYGDDAYTETGALITDVTVDDVEYPIGTSVQTMVYQPKTYYKVEPLNVSKIENGSGYHIKKARYFVSDQQLPGFKLHPAFINADGNEVDYILISAFEGSAYDVSESTYIMDDSQTVDFTSNDGDKLSSIGSSTKPISGTTQQLTRSNAEILANNRGEGWYLYNIKAASLNQLLVLIEYGNSQTGVGRGIVDITSRTLETNCSSYTGSTVGNGSGNAASTINEINGSEVSYSEDGKVSVNYRGMENPWGNMYEHVEGLTIFEGVPYVCNDFEYVETKHDGNYVSAGITMPNEVGYVKYFGYGTYECDWLFIPSAIGGSSDDVIGDYTIINPTTASHRVPILGGSWEDADSAGVYMCNVFNLTGYFACNVTARLVYYPSK